MTQHYIIQRVEAQTGKVDYEASVSAQEMTSALEWQKLFALADCQRFVILDETGADVTANFPAAAQVTA